jgi:RNA polymerase sigma factor for flagellar operon FliA
MQKTHADYEQRMLEQHLPLVKIILAKMRTGLPRSVDLDDLHSAGVLGLLSAVRKFDPSRGYAFETFASFRVRGAIKDELRSLDTLSRSARKKHRELSAVVQQLEQELGRAPSDEELCEILEINHKDLSKLRAQTRPAEYVFLDSPPEQDQYNWHDLIADQHNPACSELVEHEELMEMIVQKLETLPYRQRKIMHLYYFEGLRLTAIAQILGVSEARISQIRSQALATLRSYAQRVRA